MLLQIPPPPGDVLQLGPLTVHYYGIAIAFGVLVAATVSRRRYARFGGDPELADRTAVWAVALGFLGARLAYASTHLDRFTDRPWAVLFIWEGGLALFGGLTVGTLVGLWYLRRAGADLPAYADAIAPALPLAQAIGRWGNYFNQELYGTPTDLPWALEVEPAHRVAPYQAFETFHPTFLYESLWNVALAGVILWLGKTGKLRRGALMFVYALGYGTVRFLLELIRTDTTWRLFGLSRNAYVALAVVLVGAVGLLWYQGRAEPEPEPPEPAEEIARSETATAPDRE